MFTELMMRMANGETLTPDEKNQLELECQLIERTSQKTSSWIGADGNPKLTNPVIEYPYFASTPLRTLHIRHSIVATIPYDTLTYLDFGDDTFNSASISGDESFFKIDESNQTKIKLPRGNYSFTVDGVVSWDNDSDGGRWVEVDVNDTFYQRIGFKPYSTLNEAISRYGFSITQQVEGNDPFIRIGVYQDGDVAGLVLRQYKISVRIA